MPETLNRPAVSSEESPRSILRRRIADLAGRWVKEYGAHRNVIVESEQTGKSLCLVKKHGEGTFYLGDQDCLQNLDAFHEVLSEAPFLQNLEEALMSHKKLRSADDAAAQVLSDHKHQEILNLLEARDRHLHVRMKSHD